jgi:hypothetical protein
MDKQLKQGNKELEINDNKSTRKGKWLKSLIYFFILIASLILLFFLAIFLLHTFKGEDSLPPNDDDLLLYEVNIPENENSYFDLLKLSAALKQGKRIDPLIEIRVAEEIDIMNYLDSYSWDEKNVENLLEENREALDVYNAAAQKENFQFDLTANPLDISYDLPIIGVNSWKQVVRLSSIKAIYLMRQGYQDQAFDEAMRAIIIGDKIEESKNLPRLIYFVGIDIKKMGLETMQVLINLSPLSSEISEKYRHNLRNHYSKNNQDIFRVEYMVAKEALKDAIDEMSLKNSYYFKPNQTLELFADFFREQTERLNTPCEKDLPEFKVWKPGYSIFIYFTENVFGKLLLSTNLTSAHTRDRRCQIDALIDETINLLQ